MFKLEIDKAAKFVECEADRTVKLLLDALAGLYSLTDTTEFCAQLIAFFKEWTSFESATLFEFKKGQQPRLLFEQGANYDHDMAQYLRGLYLLDPFYDLYESHGRTGTFRLNSASWNEFGATDSYKRYWRQVDGDDEAAGLYEVAPGRCIHLSLMLKGSLRDRETTVVFLETLQETLKALFLARFETNRPLQDDSDTNRRKVHETVSQSLREFGADVLTGRERDIVQLLLKGHSAKSIARILKISPGTASIHRSNVYQKLDVTAQGELFSAFITKLTRP